MSSGASSTRLSTMSNFATRGCSEDTPRRRGFDLNTSDRDRDVRPRVPPCPRPEPIALPALQPEVFAVLLNPDLRLGVGSRGVQTGIDFGSRVPTSNKGWMAAPATFPGLLSMTLVSPCFPWPITVHASGSGVRIGEMIDAITDALSIHLTEEQVGHWMDTQDSVDLQPFHRYTRTGSTRKRKAHHCATTRLALLNGRTRFAGLSESGLGYDVWTLHLV
ncbi:hypothetical protein C8R45DRAFT_1155585 [Mycena sanguinolenta]|nr:hypothetical protein C8R45DRAFT_1155585 [Mycena sanguinolenta]